MEPTVRNPRIESAIDSAAARSALLNRTQFPSAGWSGCLSSKLALTARIPSAGGRFHPEIGRRERNFWMQRPEAKIPPERPLLSAETGNVENGWQESRRNGLFPIEDGFRGSGRLDGGGCSRAKLVSEGQNKGIREKYRAKRKKGRKK